MQIAEELYDLWATGARRSAIVVGTAKNVGKTTTVNALLGVGTQRGVQIGLTSIGRDGEAFDAVDDSPKPRIFVESGTLVAAGRALLPHPRGIAVLEVDNDAQSALGPIVFYRAGTPQYVEISGAPSARNMRAIIERLIELGSERVIIDGAIDRIAVTSTGDDAVVVATGMARAATIGEVATATCSLVERIGRGRVIACTTCPVGEGRSVAPSDLLRAVGEATGLPAFDLQAEQHWNR